MPPLVAPSLDGFGVPEFTSLHCCVLCPTRASVALKLLKGHTTSLHQQSKERDRQEKLGGPKTPGSTFKTESAGTR